jgi:hypothetical protein
MYGFIILANAESIDRYLEWKIIGKEKKKRFLQKVLL